MAKSLSIVIMGVHAAKFLNLLLISMGCAQRLSLGVFTQKEYGANKGVGEIPLNGKGAPLSQIG